MSDVRKHFKKKVTTKMLNDAIAQAEAEMDLSTDEALLAEIDNLIMDCTGQGPVPISFVDHKAGKVYVLNGKKEDL